MRPASLFYLALALTGMFGFLLVRPALFAPGVPAETMARLVQHEQLARIGIVLEMGIVLTQTLTALWFSRLFRRLRVSRELGSLTKAAAPAPAPPATRPS